MNLFDKLLSYYHISKNDYEHLLEDVNDGSIPLFTIFNNIDIAKKRILDAINNNEKILIYGDYDADGILATSILVNTFKSLNYKVDYYIPSRYLDGYGLSEDKVIKAKERGYKLIITVDNGIKAYEAINKANELNIDVIVTDHHEFNEIPAAFTYLHPKNSKFTVTTCGAVVSFFLSYALLNEISPFLLSLAGTAILADAMPLINENRLIVRLAIKYLNKYRFNKFNLLSETTIYDETVLAMNVIPKINAVGRIEENKEVNILVKYFCSDNYRELINIRDYLNATNEKRKNITLEACHNLHIDINEAIIFKRLDIISGLSGLIANRLINEYNKPVIIFSKEVKNGVIRASIRSKNGCNVIDFINQNKELFVEQGGHALAAGIEIKESDFSLLKERFISYALTHPFIKESGDIEITFEDLSIDNYRLIRSFAPFGEGWKEPSFIIKNIDTNLIKRIGKNNEHLAIFVNKEAKMLGYNYSFDSIQNTKFIDLSGNLRLNNFKNNISLNFIVKK